METSPMTLTAKMVTLLGAALLMPAEVAAAYGFEAERFCASSERVDGCDEFDDGILNGWSIDEPTAHEAGGAAVLTSPGIAGDTLVGGVHVSLEETNIESLVFDNDVAPLDAAFGYATATSFW